ncbi:MULTISPECIES: hypothetical protein [unclassified Bacillus (in: firmicutes)]|uniref:hypothetical protein n=1 Tax=unclassified Bacillus (in: firmicutes) TaxID=185979 RepID=UPI0022814E2E|nr:hypothetical protein [Bacillus sp. S20C3]MCY8289424.1 hypothetical protein [Bacillus sp. N13C7]MCY8637911.1 hypothetical protein [Bacillus sp. S17B2]MCY9145399.1 hypothetical protein [Bacillus sp. T9C1]
MKKKLLLPLFTLILALFSSGFTNSAAAATNDDFKEELSNLTQKEVVSNFQRIDQEYEIGEAFSEKDQVFIQMYAKPVNDGMFSIAMSKYISGSKSANGVTVKVSGTIKDDIQNLINQSFGASNLKTSTTAGSSKVTSVKTAVHHNAYGLVGSGGIGKVYSGSLTTSGKNTTLTGTKRYTAVVAYATTWCSVTVNHTGGTFTINPS